MTTPTPIEPAPAADLAALCERLEALAGASALDATLHFSTVPLRLADWRTLLALVACRRALPHGAPLVTVLIGPTGAGKSTLFNALIGRAVSTPGAIRPMTSRPLAYGSAGVLDFLRHDSYLARATLDIDWRPAETSNAAAFDAQVIIDTPDFDSIEADHRRQAESLLWRADRVIAVLTPEKYGDAAVWEILDRIVPLESLAACVFNKSESAGALDDCRRLLAARGLAAPIAVPRIASPDDPREFPSDVRAALALLLEPRSPTPELHERLRRAAERCEAQLRATTIAPWLLKQIAAITQLRTQLDALRAGLHTRVAHELALELDSALRRELEQRFLAEVQKIDVLREPRRWLSAPFQWVRSWLPGGGGGGGASTSPASTAEWLAGVYEARFQEFSSRLAAELRELAQRAREVATPALAWHASESPSVEECRRALRGAFDRLQQQIRAESDRIAEGLPASSKVGFYGSQVILQALTFAACWKTGGLLSFGEVAAQSLASPFVARIVAQFVSTGEAAAVERKLGAAFAEYMVEAVEPQLAQLEAQLVSAERAFPDAADWRRLVSEWEYGETERAP
ncbi:MAG: GTPase [Planctomycetota bacterium]